MKSFCFVMILAALIAFSAFGAFSMGHTEGHEGCLAAVIRGIACPADEMAFLSLALHFDVFTSFLHSTVAELFSNPFVLFFSLLALALLRWVRPGEHMVWSSHALPMSLCMGWFSSRCDFLSWLALHEKSPSYA